MRNGSEGALCPVIRKNASLSMKKMKITRRQNYRNPEGEVRKLSAQERIG
jgi:hypothetical protein